MPSGRATSPSAAGFIDETTAMVNRAIEDSGQRSQMLASLQAARGRSQHLTADWCVRYVDAWREDRFIWRRHVQETYRNHVVKKRKEHRDRRSLGGVRGMLRSLGVRDFHLSLPEERLDHDAADLRVPWTPAVGQ